MLEYISSIEKILQFSIPTIAYILREDKRPNGTDLADYYKELEKGAHYLDYLIRQIEERLELPNHLVSNPPRPVHVSLPVAIYREHRKLHQCLRLFSTEIGERHESIQVAIHFGWYRGYS